MKNFIKSSFAIAICFALFSCGSKTEKNCSNCDTCSVPCDSTCSDSLRVDSVKIMNANIDIDTSEK